MKDRICSLVLNLVVLIVVCAVVAFLSFLCLSVGRIVTDVMMPEGLEKDADVCSHEWHVVDESVGLYSGYKVYCPICGNSSTCRVPEWNQYLIDKEYEGRDGE